MPRYFYHVEDGQPLWDKRGEEHPDDGAAARAALSHTVKILHVARSTGIPLADLKLEVLSVGGHVVATMTISERL